MTVRQVPARPNLVNTTTGESAVAATPTEPMKMEGQAEKLGHKKQMVTGAPSWQTRYFKMVESDISYYASQNDTEAKGSIKLTPGCSCRVIQENDAARKDRYEDRDTPGVAGLMTQPMGAHMNPTSGPIGKSNCVELVVPAQIGNMLGGVLNASPMAMVAGGGLADIKKNQGRTYYWSCDSLQTANAWVTAINNNIKLSSGNPNNLPNTAMPGMRVGLGQIDSVVNMAYSMQNDQKNMVDPNQSLGWYQRSLKSDLPLPELHAKLITFYNELNRAGINC